MKGFLMTSSKSQRPTTENFADLVNNINFSKGFVGESPVTESRGEITKHIERLSRELAQISTRLGTAGEIPLAKHNDALNAHSELTVIQKTISARRARNKNFPRGLFGEPAWDMMLELFESGLCQRRTTVSSLCKASQVPPTTALRWIKTLTDKDIFVRRADPLDRRRVFVELSDKTTYGMRTYFGLISAD